MKFNGNLGVLRLFLIIGPGLYLVWGVLGKFARPEAYDPVLHRVILYAIVGLFIAATYMSEAVKKHFTTVFYVIASVYAAHYYFIAYSNRLSPTFVIGAMLIQMGISLTFVERKGLLIFSAYILALALPFLTIDTVFPKIFLYLGVFSITSIMWITMEGKRVLVSKLRSQRYFVEMQNAELAELNRRIKNREDRFQDLVEAVVGKTGESLYKTLTLTLTRVLEVKFAFLGVLSKDETSVSTAAFAQYDELLNSFTYELKGTPCESVFAEGVTTFRKEVAERFPDDTELVRLKAEGYSGVRISDSDGKILGILVILSTSPIQDIEFSERVMKIFAARAGSEMERQNSENLILKQRVQMVESARLASLGEMAGGVAHEINNPLAIIQGFSGIIKVSAETGKLNEEKVIEAMDRINQTCDRIGKIVKGLRVVARDGEDEPFEVFRLSDIVEDTLSLCFEKTKSMGIDLIVEDFDPEIRLRCRMVQVCQVLTNMINNSIYAVKSCEERWVKLEFEADEETGQAVILITDSGLGISPEVRGKLMRPFFTTKEIGEGTGLGLSVSLGILKDHGGSLVLRPGHENTQFKLTFGSEWIYPRKNIIAS